MKSNPRYLLLQARNPADAMRGQEVECFAWALDCPVDRIRVTDLLAERVTAPLLTRCDVVLIGGSGEYSVTVESPWLNRAFDLFRDLHRRGKPTYGSCWGFQAMAKALGGTVIHDPACGELGPVPVLLTDAGRSDPVLAPLGDPFIAWMGHEDRVVKLPPDAVELARTERVPCQALRFLDRPIYAAQFHVELQRSSFLQRVASYPRYVKQITGLEMDEYVHQCPEVPAIRSVLGRFVDQVLA